MMVLYGRPLYMMREVFCLFHIFIYLIYNNINLYPSKFCIHSAASLFLNFLRMLILAFRDDQQDHLLCKSGFFFSILLSQMRERVLLMSQTRGRSKVCLSGARSRRTTCLGWSWGMWCFKILISHLNTSKLKGQVRREWNKSPGADRSQRRQVWWSMLLIFRWNSLDCVGIRLWIIFHSNIFSCRNNSINTTVCVSVPDFVPDL